MMKEISTYYRQFSTLISKDRRRTIRAHIAEVLLNFCKGILYSALYFDEDLGCAARFGISIKFAFNSTICDLLFLLSL